MSANTDFCPVLRLPFFKIVVVLSSLLSFTSWCKFWNVGALFLWIVSWNLTFAVSCCCWGTIGNCYSTKSNRDTWISSVTRSYVSTLYRQAGCALPSCSKFIVWKRFFLLLANIVCFNASAICDLRLCDRAHLLKADDVLVIPMIGPPHFPMPTNHGRLLSDSFSWICLQSNWQQSCPFWTLLIIFAVTPPSLQCTPIPF